MCNQMARHAGGARQPGGPPSAARRAVTCAGPLEECLAQLLQARRVAAHRQRRQAGTHACHVSLPNPVQPRLCQALHHVHIELRVALQRSSGRQRGREGWGQPRGTGTGAGRQRQGKVAGRVEVSPGRQRQGKLAAVPRECTAHRARLAAELLAATAARRGEVQRAAQQPSGSSCGRYRLSCVATTAPPRAPAGPTQPPPDACLDAQHVGTHCKHLHRTALRRRQHRSPLGRL